MLNYIDLIAEYYLYIVLIWVLESRNVFNKTEPPTLAAYEACLPEDYMKKWLQSLSIFNSFSRNYLSIPLSIRKEVLKMSGVYIYIATNFGTKEYLTIYIELRYTFLQHYERILKKFQPNFRLLMWLSWYSNIRT